MTSFELFLFSVFATSVFLLGRAILVIRARRAGALETSARSQRSRSAVESSTGNGAGKERSPISIRAGRLSSGPSGRVSFSRSLDRWLGSLLRRAGIRTDGKMAMVAIVGLSVVSGMITVSANGALPLALSVSVTTLVSAILTLYLLMVRRLVRFSQQFPSSLELMARATNAGADLESALRVAMSTSVEPLKSEFSWCVQQMQLGMTPAQATSDLADRIGSLDLQLFAHTIATHGQVGGKLALALEKLSSIIRERAELGERIRSATGIARMAIFAVVAIAAFVLAYMQFAQPDYIRKLTGSSFGQKLIVYAVVSECLGLVWVAITLKREH